MLTKNDFPERKEFPVELQNFYLSPPISINDFNQDFSFICLLIKESEINNQKNGLFSSYSGKRPDQIHYSVGIGLIEEKSINYGTHEVESKLKEFKRYFEKKFNGNKYCQVNYCILSAPKISQKIARELKRDRNKNDLLIYKHNEKPFKIGNSPVYFVERDK
ncbi:hypothetical protein [Methanohalophilus euhalobius]|jgi:hypothetical protein|uniref:Uncharacterized protein n=1 Tax=Methanohalophilus euhalobius TaxID=51203 RepID=A0A314ZX83_9EURY|nr:hypothetical protein [Methanohalophilus euhalobius]PQV41788.1 hypothetical protein B0H22_1196 [Methanohalophilus euhalobius]RNI11383.1 hypothetical protein EDD83_02925 [Methanohalophilus euhalobius]